MNLSGIPQRADRLTLSSTANRDCREGKRYRIPFVTLGEVRAKSGALKLQITARPMFAFSTKRTSKPSRRKAAIGLTVDKGRRSALPPTAASAA